MTPSSTFTLSLDVVEGKVSLEAIQEALKPLGVNVAAVFEAAPEVKEIAWTPVTSSLPGINEPVQCMLTDGSVVDNLIYELWDGKPRWSSDGDYYGGWSVTAWRRPEPAQAPSHFEQAFSLIFAAYSRPGDTFESDQAWCQWVRNKVNAAFSLMQKARTDISDMRDTQALLQWAYSDHWTKRLQAENATEAVKLDLALALEKNSSFEAMQEAFGRSHFSELVAQYRDAIWQAATSAAKGELACDFDKSGHTELAKLSGWISTLQTEVERFKEANGELSELNASRRRHLNNAKKAAGIGPSDDLVGAIEALQVAVKCNDITKRERP